MLKSPYFMSKEFFDTYLDQYLDRDQSKLTKELLDRTLCRNVNQKIIQFDECEQKKKYFKIMLMNVLRILYYFEDFVEYVEKANSYHILQPGGKLTLTKELNLFFTQMNDIGKQYVTLEHVQYILNKSGKLNTKMRILEIFEFIFYILQEENGEFLKNENVKVFNK